MSNNTKHVKKTDKIEIVIAPMCGVYSVSVWVKKESAYYGEAHGFYYSPRETKEFHILHEALIYAGELVQMKDRIYQYANDPDSFAALQIAELKQWDGKDGWNIVLEN